jgi:hypothetical protein
MVGQTVGELGAMIELAAAAKRWALVAKLSAELAQRQAHETADVLPLSRRRMKR